MTFKTTTSIIFAISLTMLLQSACRPPMQFVSNKSKYFKSTKTKNILTTQGKINTTGTFIASDSTAYWDTFSMIRFNSDQTVQTSETRDNNIRPLKLDSNSHLKYLDNKVSYYYFIDKKSQTLTLERFEYWESPWWNFFVQNRRYLVEKFYIKGDTLINKKTDRFTRFNRQYILNKKLTENFKTIYNEFTTRPE